MKNYYLLFLLLIICFSCSDDNPSSEPEPETGISDVAENFLNEVLGIMENRSLNKNTIDWTTFKNQVFDVAGTAQTIDDIYESGALLKALELLGDNHSSINRNNGEFISASTAVCPIPAPPPGIESIPDNIGYIFVRGFNGRTTDEEAIAFAQNLQNVIQEKDSPDLLGWIVDLRPNTGGNMWPMLAGIGPILGNGIAGHFIESDGQEIAWSYDQGRAISGQNTRFQIQEPYTLLNENPKVAVLLNLATASSGEAIAISFINRENTTSFGSSTCGLSTANSPFRLSDDSFLILTTAVMADREKNIFGNKIEPDFPFNDDELLNGAIDWIINE